MRRSYIIKAGPIITVFALLSACQTEVPHPQSTRAAEPPAPVSPAQRAALFGELHMHTAFSTDAVMLVGTTVTPDQAYRYARGETVTVLGQPIRLKRPLDFMAVTDHAEQIGVGYEMLDPRGRGAQTPFGARVRAGKPSMDDLRGIFLSKTVDPGVDSESIGRSTWKRVVDAAQSNYQPGRFTTFVGFEWSSTPTFQNLHRNVIFKSADVAYPYSAADSERPEDLWSYLEANRRRGIEAMAIPHNGNLSNGLMYDWKDSDGRRIDRAYALRRQENEPLNELAQTKGVSETHPSLSPEDGFADFAIFEGLFNGGISKASGSYLREALGRGLVLSEEVGANPYLTGFIGATDDHGGLFNTDEAAFRGGGRYSAAKPFTLEDARALLVDDKNGAPINELNTGSGGLTGVWAESNTREAIYAAMRRRETFATSGTRLKVRLFGGWNYDRALLNKQRRWDMAYAGGVPQGSNLPHRPTRAGAPRFLVWAQKDPDGANLDRVQIIKLSTIGGKMRERIFDVAFDRGRRIDSATGQLAAVGNTVNLTTARYTNSIGAAELASLWVDPEFDPAHPAVYYARVLEIPTPRWSTVVAIQHKLPAPKSVPAVIQERGWTSPIWYEPNG